MRNALSRAQLNQLAKIAALPDDQIDTVDIPEAPIGNWALARRGDLYRPLKQSVTIRLDADILARFKQHAANGRYQTAINRILRQYVIETEKSAHSLRRIGAGSRQLTHGTAFRTFPPKISELPQTVLGAAGPMRK
jgi:uncharacterized protein (DUF4415 family)